MVVTKQLEKEQTYRLKMKAGSYSTTPQIYWGAYISGSTYGEGYGNPPWDMNTWNFFESHTGKTVSILHWGQPWYSSSTWPNSYYPFVPSLLTNTRSHGAIPMIDWSSWDISKGQDQPDFALRNIANGATYTYGGQTFDAYVTAWATSAKAWGYPFFLRFNWEMNGWWKYPWATAADPATGVTANGNTAQDYVNAWRHVHDIFTQVGATNVTWVWCPNVSDNSTIPLSQLYPGDSYVDWICLDGYNKDVPNWSSFAQLIGPSNYNGNHDSYTEITSIAPSKPLMIGEFASNEAGDGGLRKGAWISDALLNQIPQNYPKIGAVVWFNWNSDNGSSFIIESSAESQNAFASAINSVYYLPGNFASLTDSPIPPPPPLLPTVTPVPPTLIPSETPPPTPTPTVDVAKTTLTPTPFMPCCNYNKQGRCTKRC